MFYTLMNMDPLKRPCPPAVNDLRLDDWETSALKPP